MNFHPSARQQTRRVLFGPKRTFALLFCTSLTAVPAFAQQENAGGSEQLVEIVVTAQRREQNLQDTPAAVSAFGGQELQGRGVSSVQELGQVDSSLNIPAAAGVYLPFLRGIGNDAAGSVGNESSVPVYIDDVYYTRLSTAYLALGDIDRVEVLKGPQGTLFGRNSSGGAIQMFTKDPRQETEGDATIGYANYNTVSGQLYYSTPITDTLAWNVAFGGADQRDGWGRSITTGLPAYLENEATVRSKLIWEPSSGTRVKIVGFYAYTKGDIGLTQDRVRGTYGATAALIAPGYPNPPMVLPSLADTPGGFYNNRLNFRDYNLERGYGGSIRIDQNISFADLVSISAFRNSKGDGHYDSDYSPQNFFNGDLYDIDNQITQEFQIKSKKDSKIDWIGGAFYLHSKAGYEPVQLYGDVVNFPVAPGRLRTLSAFRLSTAIRLMARRHCPLPIKQI
jgi:iron complex outermembrane receptor protein